MASTYTTVSGDNLTKIASNYKTDVKSIASLNNIADPNKIGTGVVLKIPDVVTTPVSTINSDILGAGAKAVSVPPPVNNTSAQNNLSVTGAKVVNTPPPAPVTTVAPPTPVTEMSGVTDAKSAASYLTSLIGIQAGKGDFTAQTQKDQGLADKTQALTDLNNQALTTKKSYDDQIKKLRENAGGVLTPALNAQISDLQIKANDDLANIGIQQQVAQNNLAAVQKIIADKVSAKFEPIDNQIASLEKLYSLYQNDMSDSEKLAAQAKIDGLKSTKDANAKAYADVLKTASENGAPAETLQAIDTAASSPNADSASIYAAAGTYAAKKDDNKFQLQQDAQGGFVVFDPKTGTMSKIASTEGGQDAAGGINQDAVALASQYASTGKAPTPQDLKYAGTTLGQVQDIAKSLPKTDGALVDRNTGLKTTGLSATQEEGVNTLAEIVRNTLPKLINIYPKLITGGFLNPFTTQNRQEFNTLKQEFIAKLLVARSGAAVSEPEYQRYIDLMPGAFGELTGSGEKKLNSLLGSMQGSLDTKLNSYQAAIVGYTKIPLPGDGSGTKYTVGDVIDIKGNQARVNADGSLTPVDTSQSSFNPAGNASASIPSSSHLAYVNNNPGNLKFAGQEGATQGEGGFAKFSSPEAGTQALANQVKLDASRGLTLSGFISKFAPPSENDTKQYIQQIKNKLGVAETTLLKDIDMNKLVKAIAYKESNSIIA